MPETKKKSITDQKIWKYIAQLNFEDNQHQSRKALSDGEVTLDYTGLLEKWKRYAAVFTAKHMTYADKARVGVDGSPAIETLCSIYGLNMVGAQVSILPSFGIMNVENIIKTVRDEKLTDLILTDMVVSKESMNQLLGQMDSLGLHNLILVHMPVSGSMVPDMVAGMIEKKTMSVYSAFSSYFMDGQLEKYKDHEIAYDENKSRESSVILHTSGTTGGSGKPISLSDLAINENVHRIRGREDVYSFLRDNLISVITIDMNNCYCFIDIVHAVLSYGGQLAAVPGGPINPFFYKAFPEYGVTVLFGNSVLIDIWLKAPAKADFDFSSLKGVVLGGSTLSKKDRERYTDFFSKYGAPGIPIVNGYGLSELGGACTLSKLDADDDSMGYLLPGVEAKIYDDETETYYNISEAPCTGTLYLRSKSMTSGQLDGRVYVPTVKIKGRKYICTNDMVRVAENGEMTYLGRSNRFFLNEEGEKYQSGLVETEFSKQEGIENCGIAGTFEKVVHETVPMLCVKTFEKENAEAIVLNALKKVFIIDKSLDAVNIPKQVLLAEKLPYNASGKLDLYKINQGMVKGQKYRVIAEKNGEGINNITLKQLEDENTQFINHMLSGISDSADAIPGMRAFMNPPAGLMPGLPDEKTLPFMGRRNNIYQMIWNSLMAVPMQLLNWRMMWLQYWISLWSDNGK